MGVDAGSYLKAELHLTIEPPVECPHCSGANSLKSLGYYFRNVTSRTNGVLRISVRRFRCRQCGATVSILPSFAQPYRLVLNVIINEFFGGTINASGLSWLPLLKQYWKRFSDWIPQLHRIAGSLFERAPPQSDPAGWWQSMVAAVGDVEKITAKLVGEFRITLFGRYRCHSPVFSRASTI